MVGERTVGVEVHYETSGDKQVTYNKVTVLTSVLFALAASGAANAQVAGSGTMGVTATVQGSILLTFVTDPSGLAVTGTATSAASLPFGNVQMFGGTVPANVTKTVNGLLSFDLVTPFDVRVDLANSASATYILTAVLATADPVNVWTLAASNLSASGTPTNLNATGAYATPTSYSLKLHIPASAPAGLITNSIGFTATAN
jgi:hypothetical protein